MGVCPCRVNGVTLLLSIMALLCQSCRQSTVVCHTQPLKIVLFCEVFVGGVLNLLDIFITHFRPFFSYFQHNIYIIFDVGHFFNMGHCIILPQQHQTLHEYRGSSVLKMALDACYPNLSYPDHSPPSFSLSALLLLAFHCISC